MDVEGTANQKAMDNREKEPWLGTGEHGRANDGIIFSGIGALSRPSLTTVSQWMDAIFRHGEGAYGVGDNLPHGRDSAETDESSRAVPPTVTPLGPDTLRTQNLILELSPLQVEPLICGGKPWRTMLPHRAIPAPWLDQWSGHLIKLLQMYRRETKAEIES